MSHYRTARALAEEGRHAEALHSIRAALARDPDNPGYLVFQGYEQMEAGRPGEAAESFRRALDRAPDHPEARFGWAEALFRSGDSAAAASALEGTRGLEGRDRGLRRARLWARLGRHGEALAEYRRVLAARPGDAGVLREAARAAEAAGDWRAVVELARREAEARPPGDARREAVRRMARAYRILDRPADALEAYGSAASPANLEVRAELALRLGRYREAARLYGVLILRAPADEPPPRAVREAHAYALLRAGRLRPAARAYRALVDTADGTASRETRVRYAWTLLRLERYGEAWDFLSVPPVPHPDAELHLQQALAAGGAGRDSAAALLRAWLDRGAPDHRLPRAEAHLRLARLSAASGRRAEAVRHYRAVLEERPSDAGLHRELAHLLEAGGRLREALEHYRAAIRSGEAAATGPELRLRLARLHRWLGRPAGAVPWYRRYLETGPPAARRDSARWELAGSLHEAARPAEAARALPRTGDPARLSTERLIRAARIRTESGSPGRAAALLEALAGRRPLSPPERRWLAGQLLEAGRYGAAAERYAAIEPRDRTPGDWAGLAHARERTGRPAEALAALRRIPAAERDADDWLSIARLLRRTRGPSAALPPYREALRAAPPDSGEVHLEMARVAAEAGVADTALAHYRAAARIRGEAGLRVEVARNLLAAGRFREAAPWARRALEAGESPREARLALGQSLQARGRSDSAESVLAPLVRRPGAAGFDPRFQARVASARRAHLRAWRLYGEALREDPADAAALRIERARAARARGDLGRARSALARAERAGAHPGRLRAARRELPPPGRAAALPGGFTDGNDVTLREVDLRATVQTGPGPRVRPRVAYGSLEQGPFGTDRLVGRILADRWFPTPALELAGSAGFEAFDEGGDAVVGGVSGRYHLGDGSAFELEARRLTPWSEFDDPEPRRFNRVRDLEALGPAFRIDRARGGADVRLGGPDFRWRVDGGLADYDDGNTHGSLYTHLQLPLHGAAGPWTVLRPNLYLESFADSVPEYFSPDGLASAGLALHTIRRAGTLRLEGEVNPQLQWTDRGVDPGISGVLDLRVPLGSRTSLRGGSFLFAQTDDYWLVRAFFGGSVRLGGPGAGPAARDR